MIEIKDFIEIPLDHICPQMCLKIHAYSKGENLMLIENEFERYNEAKYQFFEGKSYLYELINSKDWSIDFDKTSRVFTSPKIGNVGGFNPNIFVGTFQIPFINQLTQEVKYENIEIRSSKISYEKGIVGSDLIKERSEYQEMLEEIAEYSTELILQYNVPIQQSFESGLEQLNEEKELYQRFLFVRSLFKNQEFEESVQKIISNPATKWITEMEEKDVRSIRRFSAQNIRELASRPNRMPFPGIIHGLKDIPLKISSTRKVESFDTPENRFIKHILESFLIFCETIETRFEKVKMLRELLEVKDISQRIDNLLNQPFFKNIGRPTSLKINSPILQRRNGYRELLRSWLRFHLTAQLSWRFDNDDDNLFSGGKKDIASLYEYWAFFVLFNTLSKKYGQFTNEDPEKWIEGLFVPDQFGLGLTLQQGRTQAFEFIYQDGKRPLNIKFYYNRPFAGGKKYDADKGPGSYSKSFRPDYTLSIWPKIKGLTQNKAEETESIVHIHFDAKYKVEYSYVKEHELETQEMRESESNSQSDLVKEIQSILDNSISEGGNGETKKLLIEKIKELGQNDFKELKESNRIELISFYKAMKEESIASKIVSKRDKEEAEGRFKNIDLYKMHAYKDAIRRSGGAYILYPGNTEVETSFQGFHEIIPGVGAFALRPNNEADASESIGNFIDKVISNLEDVLSQREQMAKSMNKVYADKPYEKMDPKLDKLFQEIGTNENPQDINVLVGYCRDKGHAKWIEGEGKGFMRYNIRYGKGYEIDGKIASARYLILYSNKGFKNQKMYKIKPGSASIRTKAEIETNNYKPNHELYMVFELEHVIELDSSYQLSDQTTLFTDKFSALRTKYYPFSLNLMELHQLQEKKLSN